MLGFTYATPAYAGAIAALVESAYRGEGSKRGWTSEHDLVDGERTSVQGIAAGLASPDRRIILVHEDTRLVGCAEIADLGGRVASFGMFAVDPALQGGGLGKAILTFAESAAQEIWGAARMEMWVLAPRAELIAFYERRGYRATGATKALIDVNRPPNWTRGHDLMLDLYDKDLRQAT